MLREISQQEKSKTSQVREQMEETVKMLKEKLNLLQQLTPSLKSAYQRERDVYNNATKLLQQHVQLMVKVAPLLLLSLTAKQVEESIQSRTTIDSGQH